MGTENECVICALSPEDCECGKQLLKAEDEIASLKHCYKLLDEEREKMVAERNAYREKAISLGQWFFSFQAGNSDMDITKIGQFKTDAACMVDTEVSEKLLSEQSRERKSGEKK